MLHVLLWPNACISEWPLLSNIAPVYTLSPEAESQYTVYGFIIHMYMYTYIIPLVSVLCIITPLLEIYIVSIHCLILSLCLSLSLSLPHSPPLPLSPSPPLSLLISTHSTEKNFFSVFLSKSHSSLEIHCGQYMLSVGNDAICLHWIRTTAIAHRWARKSIQELSIRGSHLVLKVCK